MLMDTFHFCSNDFKFYTNFSSVTLCYHKVQQSHIQNMACPMYSTVFAFFTSNNLSTVMTTKMAQNGCTSPVKQSLFQDKFLLRFLMNIKYVFLLPSIYSATYLPKQTF